MPISTRRKQFAVPQPSLLPVAALVALLVASCSGDDAGPGWSRLGGADAPIRAMAEFEGRLFFGGEFSRLEAFGPDEEIHALAAWSAGGPAPGSLKSVSDAAGTWYDINPEPNGSVYALAVHQGALIVAGAFTYVGPMPAGNVARWNGESWSPLGGGLDGIVYALASLGDTLLVAAGSFQSADGGPASNIAAWNGTAWRALGPGTNGPVLALRAFGGQLFAGGNFSAAGAAPANNIARWNGTRWSPLDVGVDGTVRALATFRGALAAGGDFVTVNGFAMNHVARWNGVSWQPMGEGLPGLPEVHAMIASGDRLQAAGGAPEPGPATPGGIESWDTRQWHPAFSVTGELGRALHAASAGPILAADGPAGSTLYLGPN